MQVVVTQREKYALHRYFMGVLQQISVMRLFPRWCRRILADRLVEIKVAELEGRTPPEFPPEGFEIVLTKANLPGGGTVAASIRRHDKPVGPVVGEES